MAKKNSSKRIRLTVTGAAGRMGTHILALADANPRIQVMAGVERPSSALVGHFVARGKAPVVGNIDEVLSKTDVVIDFSSPENTMKTAQKAAKKKVGLVIGTTGLKPAQLKKLKQVSRRIPIVFSPNMSVGVNLLFKLVQKAAQTIPGYDIEIIEAHHNLKKDAPSGTAMRLAELAAQGSKRSQKDFVYGRKGFVGARKSKQIGISVIRAGDIVGDHTVMLSTPGERLELTHKASSRDAFASGAVKAAVWVAKKRPGLYSMFDVLNLRSS